MEKGRTPKTSREKELNRVGIKRLIIRISALTRPFLMALPCKQLTFWSHQHLSSDIALTKRRKMNK